MRFLIRRLDQLLRRIYGVFEFTDDPDCLIRLSIGTAGHDCDLDGFVLHAEDPVVIIHIWNEHMPAIPAEGADLGWAVRGWRLWHRSLQMAATYIASQPRFSGVRAVGGATSLLVVDGRLGGVRFMERLGFHVSPYRNRLGRFGEFWDALYALALMWAYNPAGARSRTTLRGMPRTEFWMSTDAFLARYGGDKQKSPTRDGLTRRVA